MPAPQRVLGLGTYRTPNEAKSNMAKRKKLRTKLRKINARWKAELKKLRKAQTELRKLQTKVARLDKKTEALANPAMQIEHDIDEHT